MSRFKLAITIGEKKYPITVDFFGTGPIPILICGHAEIYARLLEQAFSKCDLLEKYQFFVPRSYWCADAPLAGLPAEVLTQLSLTELAKHLEEIRQDIAKQGLLLTKDAKIGIYSHSFFSALAFQYAACFSQSVLFIEAEGPPPYNTKEWGVEKTLYFEGNASKERKQALAYEKILPGESAVDQKVCLISLVFVMTIIE